MQKNLDLLTIKKITLKHSCFDSNALIFLPPKNALNLDHQAIFTHGYTSSKHDLISWATRLADHGITTTIFDLPGHYLGSFHELNSVQDFQNHAFELFALAYEQTGITLKQQNIALSPNLQLYLGGHSLGALLALKSHQLQLPKKRIFICVGLGVNQDVKVHLFDTDFYQKTLNIRRQLVSPHLDPSIIFPWIKDHKHEIEIKNEHIAIICGQDDVIVGKGGAAYLENLLKEKNTVELIEPIKLPHHEPQLAAGPIFHYIKQFL